jgi:hypothetical protein
MNEYSEQPPDMHQKLDQAFELRARELLQDSAQALDGRLRSRLTQARHAALAAMPANARAANPWRRWIPAGAVASAALMALLLVNQHGVSQPGVNQFGVAQPGAVPATLVAANGLDDLDILADNDAVDMSDDYDFYDWAATEAEGT